MRIPAYATALFSALVAVNGQDASFCLDEDCADCPTSLATSGTGFPNCVIYETETVLGGYGFEEGTGLNKYLAHGNFKDPCGGEPGAFIVRSPADGNVRGCGETIFFTTTPQCSTKLALQDTFMVQFCCGSGDCMAADVPWDKRQDPNDLKLGAGSGAQGAFLKFPNGTIIPPLQVTSPPELARRQCDGFKEDSYVADGEPYIKTFNTQIVSASIGPYEQDSEFLVTYDQSVSRTTSFDLSVGDPFGILSVSVGFSFENSETKGVTYNIPVPAGQRGVVGFTPQFYCTTGTLETCDDGRTEPSESCTPYLSQTGIVQGNYRLIQR